jgi:carboxyl-terminal processing protease
LIVLVNGRSSFSFRNCCGALQDLDRAVVVGKPVLERFAQRPVDLTYGTQLKVTISRYYASGPEDGIQVLDYSKR